jgi:uncharacterized protein YjbI with pentapeptide repeats
MKTQKFFLVSLSLLGIIAIGATYDFEYTSQSKSFTNKPGQISEQAKTPAIDQLAANFQQSNDETQMLVAEESALPTPAKSVPRKLPGIFRGDWGETPVYAKNDRVNFERAAYLSLQNDNQNQAPSTYPAFWRLVKKFKALHEEVCFSPMPGADLAECDFTEAASLKDMNLSGALLSNARLSGELGSADLSNANLSGASVIGSLVISPDTRLDHANLSKLQSDGNNPLIAESANLNNVNFSEANLYGAKLKGASFTGAQLTGATLTGVEMTSSHLEGAELSKTNLTYANLTGGVLTNAALSEANLSEANLTDADFTRANLQQANLAGSELAGVDLSGANLHGANLTAAKNTDRAIIDNQTDFTSAICPDGVGVDGTQVTTCVGHGF